MLIRFTGTETKCLNLGSYNYLGFGEASGTCADASVAAIKKYGLASCISRHELGRSSLVNYYFVVFFCYGTYLFIY